MIKKRRRIRAHNPKALVCVKYVQKNGPRHRRGRFMKRWNPSWRKK